MKPPLTTTQLRLIDHYSNTRFDCEFWVKPNVRNVIRQLLEHIKYQDSRIQGFEGNRDDARQNAGG